MTQTQLCAIGRWAARGKSNLVMLRPVGKVLAMQQLRVAAEVCPATEIEVPDQPVKDAELNLAKQLIQTQASTTFDANAFEDIVRARVQAAIEKKVAEGEEISISEAPAAAGAKVIDLMEALRASLQAAEKPKPRGLPLGD